jgi:hypothetical protein
VATTKLARLFLGAEVAVISARGSFHNPHQN